MPEPTTIDLGAVRRDPAGRGEGALPARPWRPRPLLVRSAALALVGLLAMTVAGAAVPVPAPLAPLWRIEPGDQQGALPHLWQTAVDDQRMYLGTAQMRGSLPTGSGTLTAYRLADGRVEWQVSLETFQAPRPQLANGTLVVATGGGIDGGVISGYDPVTGEQRWTRPDAMGAEQLGDLLLVTTDFSPPEPDDPHVGSRDVVAIDPATGQELSGSVTLTLGAEVASWSDPDGVVNLFTLGQDGMLTRHDLATGEQISVPYGGWERGLWTGVSVVHQTVVVTVDIPDEFAVVVTAHDPATLAQRWHARRADTAVSCGPWVCLRTDGANGTPVLRAVDPFTGDPQWELSPHVLAGDHHAPHVVDLDHDGRLWVSRQPPPADDRIRGPRVSYAPGASGPAELSRMVDADSGQPLTPPVEWQLQARAGSQLLLSQSEPVEVDLDLPPQGEVATRTWCAHADIELTEVRVLGSTEADYCLPHPPYLLCETEDEGLTIWRIHD